MATPAPTVGDAYPERRIFWPAAICGVAFIAACIHFAAGWYWCTLGAVSFVILAVMLSRRATIDYTQRAVREHSRLFDRWIVWSWDFPFSDFEAIVYEPSTISEDEMTSVGLRHRSGRCISIRDFGSSGIARSRGAEEFAWRLSCDTGIEIDECTG